MGEAQKEKVQEKAAERENYFLGPDSNTTRRARTRRLSKISQGGARVERTGLGVGDFDV